MEMIQDVFQIENVSFRYPGCDTPALAGVNLRIRKGEYVVICGSSGCGKTTLLRLLKPELSPNGTRSGTIAYFGTELKQIPAAETAQEIGFVLQNPENQMVTDKVWHELSFGPESLGLDTQTIRRRCAEMAQFFGIDAWYEKSISLLSGGQKQMLALAGVMVMQPKVLILDEPTAQLDPIAASEFLTAVKKINRELGTTVIVSEHRTEEVLPDADKVVVMENGTILAAGDTGTVGLQLKEKNHSLFEAMPAAMRIWAAAELNAPCPVSVREGKDFLELCRERRHIRPFQREAAWSDEDKRNRKDEAVRLTDVTFRYGKDEANVLQQLNFRAVKGEHCCLLGGNGSGKTTLLKLVAGVRKPQYGTIACAGSVGMLPQNPQTLFLKQTVREDLLDVFETKKPTEEQLQLLSALCGLCGITLLLDRHPFDLSGGEQQRVALTKVLLRRPDILLLDEPTKGMDCVSKKALAGLLRTLQDQGICIITVSHDIEFCASYADRCGLLFDGGIASEGRPENFFGKNYFYTTAAQRICREVEPAVITCEDAVRLVGGKPQESPASYDRTSQGTVQNMCESPVIRAQETEAADKKGLRQKLRMSGTLFSLIAAGAVYCYAAGHTDYKAFINHGAITDEGLMQLGIYGLFCFFLILAAIFAGKNTKKDPIVQPELNRRKLPLRTKVAAILILLLIPLTLYLGLVFLKRKQYYLTATAVLLECMLPFFLSFEGKKPRARELVLTATLCAISVAGRAVFFMLPQFKPVLAMTILSGVALGGETGFLVGAVSMLVSNILFSQGPWTPWQMFAMGIIGYLAGILYRKGILSRGRIPLAAFGAVSAIVIYGGIMNPTSLLLWSSDSFTLRMLLTYYITGFPFDAVHALATVLFLWFGAEPMLDKLERVKRKYGLME